MNTKHKQETEENRKRGDEPIIQPADQVDSDTSEADAVLEEAAQIAEKDMVKKAEAQLEQQKDKLLRLSAEFENYKKRTLREKSELIKSAGQEVIMSLLPVLDDLERALKNATGADDKTIEGVQLIYQKLKSILEQKGLKSMEVTGQPFDTDLHDAITSVKADDSMKGKVIEEAEKGYFLNGIVLRHAKVIVGE